MTTRVLTWDWREQPDIHQLARDVHDVSGGTVHITAAETHSDEYAIVISDQPLSTDDAYDAYRDATTEEN